MPPVPMPWDHTCSCTRLAWEEERQHASVVQKMKGWIRKAQTKRKVHLIPKVDKTKMTFQNLPQELIDIILSLAFAEDARVHELVPDSKLRRRQYRSLNRMILRSTNYQFVPTMLHVCQEWRKKALRQYTLCERTPRWPHPDWHRGQPCLTIKPFWFNAKIDTLYLGRGAGGWLGYVWAHTDIFWLNGLLEGWQHVGLDLRVSTAVTRPQSRTIIMEQPPVYKLRQMIPSLKRLSIVIDNSPILCPTPFRNNTFFQASTMAVNYDGTLVHHQPGPRQWREYLATEYSDEEMPSIDVKAVVRKKERAVFWDRWIAFYLVSWSS